MKKKVSDVDKQTLGQLDGVPPTKLKKQEEEKMKIICVHCQSEDMKKIFPETKLIDSNKVLYECKKCMERQYS